MKGSLAAMLRALVLPYGAVSGRRIVLDGVNGVINIYNTAGNVVAAIDANGMKVIGNDGTTVQMATGGVAQLLLVPPTTPGVGWINGFVIASEDGTAEHRGITKIDSPMTATTGRRAVLTLTSAGITQLPTSAELSADTTRFTSATANDGVMVVTGSSGRVSVLTNNVEEPWQPIVFANGWANQGNGAAGQPAPFRAVLAAAPRRHVAISGVLNGPANGGLSVGNVLAAYAPKYRQPVMCYASPASGVPFLIIEPSGAITPVGVGATASVWVNGIYPLD